MRRSPLSDRVATTLIATFIVDAIDDGACIELTARIRLDPGPRPKSFDHLPAGIIREAARVFEQLGLNGEATIKIILEHTTWIPDASAKLECSGSDVLSHIRGGALGAFGIGGDWLVSRRGLQSLVVLAETDRWFAASQEVPTKEVSD